MSVNNMVRTSKPARLAMVVQGLDLCGAVANCCRNQAEALSGEYRVTILSDTGSHRLRRLHRSVTALRVRTPRLLLLRRLAHVPREFCFILAIGLFLLTKERRHGVSGVVFHSHPATALLAPVLRWRLRCSTVLVMHGDIHDRPAGTYDSRLTAWYKATTRRAYRTADAIIVLSPYMRDYALAGGATPERVFLVPNGVGRHEIGLPPEALPTPPPCQGDASAINLLLIGRVEHNKGADLLVLACAAIKARFPRLSLTCIGAANPEFKAHLMQLITKHDLEGRVHFLPPQGRHELGLRYIASSLVVVPSRSETQSTVLMEAMAAGRAVVASNTGGNAMMVEHGKTGLLFTPEDVSSLQTALEQLLSNPALLESMGYAAYQRHAEHYSSERSAKALQDAFSTIERLGPRSADSVRRLSQ